MLTFRVARFTVARAENRPDNRYRVFLRTKNSQYPSFQRDQHISSYSHPSHNEHYNEEMKILIIYATYSTGTVTVAEHAVQYFTEMQHYVKLLRADKVQGVDIMQERF